MTAPRSSLAAPSPHRRAVGFVAPLLAISVIVFGAAPAAMAAPDAPVIVSPGDGATTTGSTATISGTVADWGGAGGYVEVTATHDGIVVGSCDSGWLEYYETDWSCDVDLLLGDNTVTAQTFAGEEEIGGTDQITITRGGTQAPTIGSPAPDAAFETGGVTFSGTGPALGHVDLGSADGEGFTSWCDVGVALDGTWSCTIDPIAPGDYDVGIESTRIDGTPDSSAWQTLEIYPHKPEVTISAGPGSLESITSATSGGDAGATWRQYDSDSVTGFWRCPVGWSGDYGEDRPDAGPEVACAVPNPMPGTYLLSSVDFDNGTHSFDRGDLVRIPAIPEITEAVANADGSLTLRGTVDPTWESPFPTVHEGSTVVVELVGEFEFCDAVTDAAGAWECTGVAPSGLQVFDAFAISRGFADDPDVAGVLDGYHDGVSPRSGTLEVAVAAFRPASSLTLAAAAIDVRATGPAGSVTGVAFHRVTSDGEGGYSYGYPVETCEHGGTEGDTSSIECGLDGLDPGIWNVYSWATVFFGGESAETHYRDDYVLIPSAPTLGSTVSSSGSVTFSGSAGAGDRVSVFTLEGAEACSTTATASDTWTCTDTPGAGTHSYRAISRSQGFEIDVDALHEPDEYGSSFQGYSTWSATTVASVAVTSPSSPAPAPTPTTATATATTTALSFTVSPGPYFPGDAVTFSGSGAPAGAPVTAELHSTPVALGQTTADSDGGFRIVAVIPEDVEPGEHEFVIVVMGESGALSVVTQPIVIDLPTENPASSPDEAGPTSVVDDDGGSAGGEAAPRTEPAAPSVLTEALVTFGRILDNPGLLAAAGALALALLFLVAIPTELLTATLSSNTGRMGRGIARVEAAADRVRDRFITLTGSRAAAAAVLVVLVSIVFGFSDPAFGFDLVSLRLVLSLAIAFFILFYGVSWLTGLIVDRGWKVTSVVTIQPSIVLFAILGVVFSRLVGFAPGIFIGVVIGIEMFNASRRAELGAALVQFAGVFALSIAAWFGYSALSVAGDPHDFWGALTVDTLAAITSEGLTGVAIAILPLAFLEGRTLWEASKSLWFGTFLVIATGFSLIVLPTALEETDPADVGIWYVVLAVFGALAFAAWGYFAWRARVGERTGADATERNTTV
ncbi:MAG: hypothetical protein CMF56_03015 [Leifsonia sp.]|nr:hypothetical protein [Leifsonia sp.]|tara:strand:+ start:18494 stop:21883 length:3390 start_codon:yes stop_codon:yes gene_type:complete